MSSVRFSRRQFLAQSTLLAGALGFPAIVSSRSPNAKINLAFIGVGGRGAANIQSLVGTSLYPKKPKEGEPVPVPQPPTENVVATVRKVLS